MRLRMCIQRNKLPDVNTLWPVPARQYKNTVAQLLEDVNKTFPLESDSWGLENYTVAIGTYECLHYHEIGTIFKDEDEVIIRPLRYAEVRARTLLGRDQITPDGRHLQDGVAFGRPLLRGVVRPELDIPPQNQLELYGESQDEEEGLQVEIWEDAQYGSSDLSRDIVTLQTGRDGQTIRNSSEELELGHRRKRLKTSGSSPRHARQKKDSRTNGVTPSSPVTREQSKGIEQRMIDLPDDEEDIDDDEDADFAPGLNDSGSESASVTSDSSSESSNSDDEAGQAGVEVDDTSSDSSSESDSESAVTSSDSSGEWSGISTPRSRSQSRENTNVHRANSARNGTSKDNNPQAEELVGVPGEGLARTKQRNNRRRDSKKLKHMKACGLLSPNATFADLPGKDTEVNDSRTNIENEKTSEPQTSSATNGISDLERKRQELLQAILTGGVDVTEHTNGRDAQETDDQPEVQSSKPPERDSPSWLPMTSKEKVATDALPTSTPATDFIPSSVSRRSRLDLAGAKRIVFGSLGSRVPKTQQEKESVQDKLASRAGNGVPNGKTRSKKIAPADQQAEASMTTSVDIDVDDFDSWRDRIDLSAFECCEEGVNLSEPPFPFYQRWDPQQRLKKERKAAYTEQSYYEYDSGYVESYDKYNQDGSGDALNYDDEEDVDEYWEEGALLGADGDDDQHDDEQNDDFPALPDDIANLPVVDADSAKPGHFIVYKELACSAATQWQPTEVMRTARLETQDKETGEWTILLAKRDMPVHEYDEDGNRIYTKFEMQGADDDDAENEDGRRRQVNLRELQDPRLLAGELNGTA